MSMGYGGWCSILTDDKDTVIYQYASYNLNDINYRNDDRIEDGLIIIEKNALVKPIIYEKIKRLPNGKKKTTVRRILNDVSYNEIYERGLIQINNTMNCWKVLSDGCDFIAWKLIYRIFEMYQLEGHLPEKININY